MANIDFGTAWDQANDAQFQKKVAIAISATGMSVGANAASSAPRIALARQVLGDVDSYADKWAPLVRVSGSNITVTTGTLTDDQITSGVEGVFAALAGA